MAKESFLEHATQTLANKPIIGITSTAGGGGLAMVNVLTPYLEFTVLSVSLVIGLITLYGVGRKYVFKRKN